MYKPSLFNLLRGERNFDEIRSARRQYEIQYTEWRMSSSMQEFMYYFLYIACNKYTITIKEKCTKYAKQNPSYFVATFSTFLQN
jgi:hypothetical protein